MLNIIHLPKIIILAIKNVEIRITKLLFGVTIILSAISFVISRYGHKEIYPFFYWKLYEQPLGSKGKYSNYRIYGITENDTVRIANKGYHYLNQDDYYYFISNEVQQIKQEKHSKEYFNKRIQQFGKLIAPKFKSYIVIEENFKTFTDHNKQNYTKNVVFKTH